MRMMPVPRRARNISTCLEPRTARPDQAYGDFRRRVRGASRPRPLLQFNRVLRYRWKPVGFQSRHRVGHRLPRRAGKNTSPLPSLSPWSRNLDFRSLTSDVACRSNDGGAMLPPPTIRPACGSWINIRPDALAQVLDREGVVALVCRISRRSLALFGQDVHS